MNTTFRLNGNDVQVLTENEIYLTIGNINAIIAAMIHGKDNGLTPRQEIALAIGLLLQLRDDLKLNPKPPP